MTEIIEGYRGVSELRSFFRTDQMPIYLASPTAFPDEAEAFFPRILPPGDLRYCGADLGALITHGWWQADNGQLADWCRRWMTGIKTQFDGSPRTRCRVPVTEPAPPALKAA
jgi:hypothetical protein